MLINIKRLVKSVCVFSVMSLIEVTGFFGKFFLSEGTNVNFYNC